MMDHDSHNHNNSKFLLKIYNSYFMTYIFIIIPIKETLFVKLQEHISQLFIE